MGSFFRGRGIRSPSSSRYSYTGLIGVSNIYSALVGLDFAGRIIVPIVVDGRGLTARGLDTPPGERAPSCDELLGDGADAATTSRNSL